MVKLSETNVEFNGKVFINDPIVPKILNKLPVGVIKIELSIGIERGKIQDQSNPSIYRDVGYFIEETNCALTFQSIPISRTLISSDRVDPNLSANISYTLRISLEDLNEIESKRSGDITLNLVLEGKIAPHLVGYTNPISSERFKLDIPWIFSEKQWIKFLEDLGYGAKWIVEIDRPDLEGFDRVKQFLDNAKEELYVKFNPAAAIDDLRRARDSFKEYFDQNREKIYKLIDEGSVGEENYSPKSKRIGEMYDAISKWLNIGPHGDKYLVTYQDALLGYRQFITMLSYLSSILAEIKRREING
jgi:hypothetical protein